MPFRKGDPNINRTVPGPGRPSNEEQLAWKEALAARLRPALDAYDDSLAGKLGKGYRFAAAKDVVALTDPDRNKQKHEVTGSVQWVIELPALVSHGNGNGQKSLASGAPTEPLPPGRDDG